MTVKQDQPELFGEDPDQLEAILESLEADQKDDVVGRMPAMLQSLVALVDKELERLGMPNKDRAARAIVIAMSTYFRGMQLYIPRDEKLRIALRDIRIYQECNGRNHDALAVKYGLTTIQIYAIVRQQKAADRKRRQLNIF